MSSESIQIKWSSFSLNGWSASLCQSISRTSSLYVPTKRFGAQSLHFSVSTLLKNKNVPLKGNLAGESLRNSFITLGMSSSHLSSICSPNTWQEGSIVKTRKDQGFHPTVNIPSNSAVMLFKTDAETDGFTSSSPWKHFESPAGSFLPFGHLVFYLLWLFLAATAAAVRNKSEEGWEAWALDRREAERLHDLLDVEESFAAAALDKEWPMERERGSKGTRCWQNVETEPVWGQTVSFTAFMFVERT